LVVLVSVLQPGSAFERFGFVGAFPGEFDIVAAKVAVGGSLPKDRFTQVQVTDDRAGTQVKICSTWVRGTYVMSVLTKTFVTL
jgi:hypothetical protein